MKLHPTCALSHFTMAQYLLLSSNYVILTSIVLVTMLICSKRGQVYDAKFVEGQSIFKFNVGHTFEGGTAISSPPPANIYIFF